MLRVIIDNGNAPPQTGIGVYSAGLFRALVEYPDDALAVTQSTAPVVQSSLRPLWRLVYLWNLKLLSMRAFDGAEIVHFTNVYVPPRIPNVAFVSTIHDIDAIIDPAGYSRRYRLYFHRAAQAAVRRAHLIATVSHHARMSILERFSVEEARVKVLANGLSHEFVQAADHQNDCEEQRERYFFFVGSLSVKKNIPWLIRTFVRGVTDGLLPKVRLVLAGRPGFGFREVARELDRARAHVSWMKAPSTADVVRLYRGASVVVLPSRTEGFGIPLIEAMYLKIPVVASDIPTSREIAAGAGHFFQLGSEEGFFHAANEAYADREKERRSALAKTIAERFLWKNLVPSYVEAYREARSSLL